MGKMRGGEKAWTERLTALRAMRAESRNEEYRESLAREIEWTERRLVEVTAAPAN